MNFKFNVNPCIYSSWSDLVRTMRASQYVYHFFVKIISHRATEFWWLVLPSGTQEIFLTETLIMINFTNNVLKKRFFLAVPS